ncbi:unnamed protein product [Larinioides sclopetarius]|uniref:Centromere protein J C-terminal domain-containing protein n=1 Tax=Larinioides sclopetarius TaxID=280406 RepID=A0AAV1Z400_9ARAC
MSYEMADSVSVHQPSDVMAVINHLREWRESQRQKFLNKQLIEHKKIFEQSGIRKLELQMNQELLAENSLGTLVKDRQLLDEIADRNLSGSNSTLQDSSITGHILHCFSDTSFGSSTVNRSKDEITDAGNAVLSNESDFSSSTSLKKNENSDSEHLTKPILKVNPAFQINKSSPQKINHVKFVDNELLISNKASEIADKLYNTSESSLALDNEKGVDTGSSEGGCSTLQCENTNDEENGYNENLNMEKKELAEFELLENCAQNSSFNSDSSIVQRVLQGESLQPLDQIRKPSFSVTGFDFDHSEELKMDEIPINSEKLNLGDFLDEQRKQHLQDIIIDTDLGIASLNRGTSNLHKDVYDEVHERCSTPVGLSNEVDGHVSLVVSDSESSTNSSSSSIIFNSVADSVNRIKVLNSVTGSGMHNSDENGNSVNIFQNNQYGILKLPDVSNDLSDVKAKLCERMEALNKEIETYQELNSELQKEKQMCQEHNLHLASIRAERDENLKKLQKSWDEFQKHKEDEEKKLEDKRRQLKMREETFNRYQKLRRDNPSRKEREELAILRQEVEKLQEELKRQRIRFTNENKRLKNQLIAAEQERDCLKLENITLEEQCQDLLATLKSRHIKKKHEVGKKLATKKKEIPTAKNHLGNNESLTSSEITTKIHDSESNDKDASRPRVRFNLVPQFDSEQVELFQSNLQTDNEDGADIMSNIACEAISETPAINESNKEELPYEEIKHDNQIERIYFSGEKEIIRPSGIIKHISADGKTVTYRYPNGDTKEVYPDSSVICKFITGVIEKRFPGGIQVTEHPNGQIEKRSPGLEEVKFPDGTTQTRYIFPDGSEKIEYNDGTKVTVERDGTEIAQFKNGVKEIRTAKYKRKEYPDGSVKIIYDDGSQETRYSNGRVKKKDQDGRILLDTKILQSEFNLSFQGSKCS